MTSEKSLHLSDVMNDWGSVIPAYLLRSLRGLTRVGRSALGALKSSLLLRRLANDEHVHAHVYTEQGKGKQHRSPNPSLQKLVLK